MKEALYPDGSLMFVTRLRKEGTKGNYPAIAHIPNVREYREYLEKWFDARVKHRIGLAKLGSDEYRGLDPESHVFLSNWRGMWQPFSSNLVLNYVVTVFIFDVAVSVSDVWRQLFAWRCRQFICMSAQPSLPPYFPSYLNGALIDYRW